jgi:hypothetical protein
MSQGTITAENLQHFRQKVNTSDNFFFNDLPPEPILRRIVWAKTKPCGFYP